MTARNRCVFCRHECEGDGPEHRVAGRGRDGRRVWRMPGLDCLQQAHSRVAAMGAKAPTRPARTPFMTASVRLAASILPRMFWM